MRSSLDGGSSSGGDHTPVSLSAGAMPSGSITGDQCEVRGDATERQRVVGIAAAADFAAGKLDVVRQHVELLRGDAVELVAHLRRGDVRRDRGARGEAARIGAGRDRPLILGGVDFQHDFDVVDFRPSSRATICASTVSWLWPCTVTSAVTETAPSGSILTVAIDTAPFLGPAFSRACAVISVDR